MRNKVSIIGCIIGGIMMIIASVVSSALVYQLIVDYISGQLGEYEAYVRIFLAICITYKTYNIYNCWKSYKCFNNYHNLIFYKFILTLN